MLKKTELYYLNKALPKRQIYGFDIKEIKTRMLDSKESLEDIKNGLIKKGYLNENGELNQISFNIITSLEKYNNAKRYYFINDTIGAIGEDNIFYYFRGDKEDRDSVLFQKTPKEGIILKLVNEYKFLKEPSRNNINRKKEKIPLKTMMLKILSGGIEEVLYIRVQKSSKEDLIEKYNIYFKDLFKICKYDAIEETICDIASNEILIELAEIFNIEVKKDGDSNSN